MITASFLIMLAGAFGTVGIVAALPRPLRRQHRPLAQAVGKLPVARTIASSRASGGAETAPKCASTNGRARVRRSLTKLPSVIGNQSSATPQRLSSSHASDVCPPQPRST